MSKTSTRRRLFAAMLTLASMMVLVLVLPIRAAAEESYPEPWNDNTLKAHVIEDGVLSFPNEPALGNWYRVNIVTTKDVSVAGNIGGSAPTTMTISPISLSKTDPDYSATKDQGSDVYYIRGINANFDSSFIVSHPSNESITVALEPASAGTVTTSTMGDTTTLVAVKNLEAKATLKIGTGIPMYRLYNPNSGEHFYTANASERDSVVAAGWNYEGIGWFAPKSGDAVYRLYNANGGEHHYTLDVAERDMLVKAGWNYEGIGWQSDAAKTTPVYREYNPNQFSCNHNYTPSKSEHDYLVSIGWHNEGIGWYAL